MNSLIPEVASVLPENWNTVIAFNRDTQKALRMLSSYYLGPTSTPTFGSITLATSLTLSFLTASRLVATNASKALISVGTLSSWIAGTANEVDITDDGDGTITIGIVNPLIVGKGGTGVATLTDHGILLGSGTDSVTSLGVATNGQLPIGSTGLDPVLSTLTGTTNQLTVTNTAGTITLSTPQDIHTGASPTLVTVKLTSLTDTYIPYHVNDTTGLANSNITYDLTTTTVNLSVAQQFLITSTLHTTVDAVVKINVTTATSSILPLYVLSNNSMTTGGYAYGIYNYLSSSTIVTGSTALYYTGISNTVIKEGADTDNGTSRVYGINSQAYFTGYTDVGHHYVYGGYFGALGSTGGDSEAYGVYCSASGADQNYAIFASGDSYFQGYTACWQPNGQFCLNALNGSTEVKTSGYQYYGMYSMVDKSGADATAPANTATCIATYGYSRNIGSTDVGIKKTYGGYFMAVGDTAGTATTYGIYTSASGADTNWAIYCNAGDVNINDALYTTTITSTGVYDIDVINTVAAGERGINLSLVQGTNALTGTLRGIYSVVTNGEFASSGTIRAIEGKARAALSDLTGGNVGTLEGMSLSADAKNKTVTTMRGAEIILDGQSGASVTTAVGLRISNNFQANIATASYGLQIYRDSFDYTADISLSKGGLITGETYANQDLRTTGSPSFAGVVVDTSTLFVDPVTHRVGIGTRTPVFQIDQTYVGGGANFIQTGYGGSCNFISRRSNGTLALPTAIQDGEGMLTIGGRGYMATGFSSTTRASIVFYAAENWTDLANGAFLTFETTPVGSTTRAERLRVDPTGHILINKKTSSGAYYLDVNGKIRADTAFNLNGTDGVTAGPYTTITSITVAGGIITAITGS